MDREQTQLMHWWSLVRWFMVVVLFSIGLLHIRFQETMVETVLFFGVFLGVVCLNILFHLQSNQPKQGMILFQVVLDTLFATIVVHFTGGLNSYFVWVYLIAVITASLTIPKVGGIFAGLTGSLCLLVLTALYQNGIISPTALSELDATNSTIYVLSYTGLFSGVAFIATYMNDFILRHHLVDSDLQRCQLLLNDTDTELAREREKLKQFNDLRPTLKDVGQLKHDINTPLCVITLSLSRVKRAGIELNNEGLQKSNNEITEAVNKISSILTRIDDLNAKVAALETKEGDHV
jgi:hypothetical protein